MKWKKNAKKVTSFFLALVMVISLFAGFEFESNAADYVQSSDVFADANGDGIINRLDPIRLRKNLAGSVSSNNTTDINGDAAVDALDLVLSKKIAAGQLDEASFYSREISGDTYKFIFGRRANAVTGTMNELTWDAEENAYHYHIDGTVPNGYADRRLWFDASFVNKVIQYTGATSMTFDIKASAPQSTSESILYHTVSPTDYLTLSSNFVRFTPPTTYQTIEVNFSELPLDASNNMMMPLLLFEHGAGDSVDLYISDITFHVPEEEGNVEYERNEDVGTLQVYEENFIFSETTVSGAHNNGMSCREYDTTNHRYFLYSNYTTTDEKWGLKIELKTPIKNVTSDMKLRLRIHGGYDDSGDAPFRLYHLETTMNVDLAPYVEVVAKEDDWNTIIVDLSKLVDEDGTFRGFQFVNYNTSSEGYYFDYIEIVTATPVVEWEAYSDAIYFNETNVAYGNNTVGTATTGLSGLHNSVTTVYTTDNKIFCKTAVSGAPYYGRKFTLNAPMSNVTSDMKLRMYVYAADGSEPMDLRLYHIDYAGDANNNYTSCAYNYTTEGTSVVAGWQTVEFELAELVDSDGTFRGFQIGNFDSTEASDRYYYFNWIQIWREKPEDVWEVHDTREFNSTDFTDSNLGITGLTDYASVSKTTLDGRDAYLCVADETALTKSYYSGRTFTLNTPIAHVTSDMKLRMRVMVVGDGTETTDAKFRLYNLSETESPRNDATYVEVIVPYSKATIIEIDIAKLLDSDGMFRGFKYSSFPGNLKAQYYFNWLDIVKLQEEFDPVDYTLDFAEPNVTVSLNDLDDLNPYYTGTFTTDTNDTENEILSFAYNHTTKWPYGGGKVTFKQAIENCTEDMLVTFRVKVTNPESNSTEEEPIKLWFYKADAYGKQANNTYTEKEVPVGEWTEVSCALKDLMVDGKFDGFFWANASNTYTVAFDSLTVQQSDAILTNGVSAYRLLVPKNSSNLITTATDEFNLFFGEATGTELDVVSDANVVEGQKYISIGETSLLAKTDIKYETSELGSDGFKIVTEGDNIYAIGGSDYGSLYAVYELLAELVNYDYIYKDTYVLEKNVKDIALEEFNICEIPDIATRAASDGVVSGDQMSMYRMRVRPYSESMIWTGNNWVHTSFDFVNGVASDSTTNANVNDNWFNDNKTQLCYTAHGDSKARDAMLDACLNTLKGAIKRFSGIRRNVVFGNQDNDYTCTCDSCVEMKNQYGADSAAAILFLDDLRGKLDDWFATKEGQAYAGEFNIIFLAYKGYEDAPTTSLSDDLQHGVNCMLSTIKADYYQPITAENATNETYHNTITQWGEITDNLYTWYYGTNFNHYLAPYDNISNMQTNYQLAVNSGATYLFDQRQHNERGFVTGWSNLKSYLSSKLMWDVDGYDVDVDGDSVDDLTDQFFDAYFGPAAANMRQYYDELVDHTQNTNLSIEGFGGTKSVVQDLINSTYWPKNTLNKWLGYCDAALNDIASLESSDAESYQKYKNHIEGEKLAILYLYIECYLDYNNAVEEMYPYMTKVKEIVENLGVTRYSEAGSISTLLDKWGVSATEPQVVWTHGATDTGIVGVDSAKTISYAYDADTSTGIWKLTDCNEYSAHKLAFVDTTKTYTGDETVTIKIKATPSTSGINNLKLYLYPYDYAARPSDSDDGLWGYGKKREKVEVSAQGTETTIEFPIELFLDNNKKFTGFGFVTYNYSGYKYTIEIGDITVK